jgi:hypothetical protein
LLRLDYQLIAGLRDFSFDYSVIPQGDIHIMTATVVLCHVNQVIKVKGQRPYCRLFTDFWDDSFVTFFIA